MAPWRKVRFTGTGLLIPANSPYPESGQVLAKSAETVMPGDLILWPEYSSSMKTVALRSRGAQLTRRSFIQQSAFATAGLAVAAPFV